MDINGITEEDITIYTPSDLKPITPNISGDDFDFEPVRLRNPVMTWPHKIERISLSSSQSRPTEISTPITEQKFLDEWNKTFPNVPVTIEKIKNINYSDNKKGRFHKAIHSAKNSFKNTTQKLKGCFGACKSH